MLSSPRLFLIAFVLILCALAFDAWSAETSVIAPLASRSLLLDIQAVGTDTLVAVGERGHVLFSEDRGSSWNQVVVPTRATLTGVFFTDRQHGWAVGHDQVILQTRDGGSNWKLVYENPEAESPLLDVFFQDNLHGFAVGAYGQFLETFDGGDSWEARWISDDDFHLNQILAVGEHLFIAAEAGLAYRSDDGGDTWLSLTPDYEGSFFGILPLDEQSLLLFGLRGNLFRSDDAGESWAPIVTATEASLTAGLRLTDETLIIGGMAGAILVSSDNGKSFELRQDPERRGFSGLAKTTDGRIIAVGDFGVTGLQLQGNGTR